MGWNGFIAVLFVFLLISNVPCLGFDLNGRKLRALEPANKSAPAQVPHLPNPVPGAEKLNPKTNGTDKSISNHSELTNSTPTSNTTSPNVTAPLGPHLSDRTDNESNHEKGDNEKKLSPPRGEEINKKPSPEGKRTDKKLSPPQGEDNDKESSPPEGKEIDKKPNPPQAKELDKKPSPSAGVLENCDGIQKKCQIQNTLTGCIRDFESDSKELEILVQNDGQETLTVDITLPTSPAYDKKDIPVPKHQITKVNISNVIGKASEIVLSTGNNKCKIDIGLPLPEGSTLFHLPNTEKLLTPVNGAYFLILTVVIFGGVWACCKFTKRRRHGSVPYQELEMASPETVSAAYVETAEGWDQGWDDDWDEENSVKSPAVKLHTGNISANGLNSRPANRDGWENDWND